MPAALETERTLLRPFELSDAESAFSWFSDAEVMRHIPLGPDSTVEDTAARITRYMTHQSLHGFSKWVIIDRDSGKLIGDSGFYFLPDGKRIELGYRLTRSQWGKGFATEVGRRWIEAASHFIQEPMLYAFAHPENGVSLQIIRKLGFKYLHHETFYGWDVPMHGLAVNAVPESIPLPPL